MVISPTHGVPDVTQSTQLCRIRTAHGSEHAAGRVVYVGGQHTGAKIVTATPSSDTGRLPASDVLAGWLLGGALLAAGYALQRLGSAGRPRTDDQDRPAVDVRGALDQAADTGDQNKPRPDQERTDVDPHDDGRCFPMPPDPTPHRDRQDAQGDRGAVRDIVRTGRQDPKGMRAEPNDEQRDDHRKVQGQHDREAPTLRRSFGSAGSGRLRWLRSAPLATSFCSDNYIEQTRSRYRAHLNDP